MTSEEQQHIDIIKEILEHGQKTEGRNGSTKSLFVRSMKFSLNGHLLKSHPKSVSFDLPISTTGGTFTKGLIEEFKQFVLNGSTDSNLLEQNGVNIWRANTENSHGIIGPAYGHNYRNYGGTYDPSGSTRDGIDQLEEVIRTLNEEPNGRRHIILNYDPRENDKCVLYPCQMLFQFYVSHEKEGFDGGSLSVHSYNRSSDICCAGMWNTGFASLLCAYVALKTNLRPDKVIMTFGNVHVYENQESLAREHILRTPKAKMPKCTLDTDGNIFLDNFDKTGYYPGIKYPMTA